MELCKPGRHVRFREGDAAQRTPLQAAKRQAFPSGPPRRVVTPCTQPFFAITLTGESQKSSREPANAP